MEQIKDIGNRQVRGAVIQGLMYVRFKGKLEHGESSVKTTTAQV